ncbi:peptide/nickel transport system substrate-binding protein [Kitasatospora sp. MAP12-15]|uniref:ABC transporter substrate-binding protein n=1 Tax=unclassified Kitasatospora TaxID=2633591 RepID=UPI0024764C1C|nr:ABC transporter substrate-binding protein [Kitasatospora sp. MAP12-44]MDH6115211.1 peptide/nickel transport system substrate-binding protein [Kitasatospora sp. MAP12-44]
MNTRLLRAVVSSSAVVLLAAACGPGTTAQKAGAASNFSTAQVTTAPGTGKLADLAWSGDYRAPYSEDPVKTADYPEETILGNVCEPLIRVAADYSMHPGVAASWSQPDPKHVVVQIDPRATFSDGKPVTADDVVYSLARNLDPAVASNYADSYNDVDTITATGPAQVTIALTKPDYIFVRNLGILGAAVVEKAFAVKAGANFGNADTGVVCSGPYAVQSFDGTNQLVLKKNPAYWDPSHAGKADTVTFKFLSDPSALANALSSGSLQGAFDLQSSTIAQLSKAAAGKLYIGGAGSTTQNVDLAVSSLTGGLADARTRQALSMAIDRAGIAKAIYAGAADPLYAVAGPGFWLNGPATSSYQAAYDQLAKAPDLAGATKLVQQAGATGKPVTLAYAAGTPSQAQLAQVLQQTGQSIGLNIKIVGLPDQQYGSLFTDPKARAAYDGFLTINYLEFPEAASMYASYATATGVQNFNGYANPAVQAALDAAQATADPVARATQVLKAQAILGQDLPWIPIVQPRALLFQNKAVTGAPLTFSYMDNAWATAVGAP